jgi:hypothetical protein
VSAIDFASLTAPCNASFGEPAIYQPAAGGSTAINGVFDEAYEELTLTKDGSSVTSASPILGMQPSDLPAPPLRGDRLTILRTGEIFIVKEVRPDSHGWAILMLDFVG